MATSFPHVLLALASAALYSSMAISGNAWADDPGEVASVPAELMQWHSGLTWISNACVIPEQQRPSAATLPGDAAVYLVMHRAVGLGDAGLQRSNFWFNSFDAPIGARKFPRIPGDNPDVFQ